ncbi:GntR family transcriptional regulator [Telmatospirillum siberiense]|uniref:GntR family transcriptional regulator n=1 Tax=Telmatospirillum siberiense TaxID=382514 RepID=A0A2N3PVG5_9PROT|nr:GntR family transcriptional regulator [Telmatospirillum siberiense]PKU24393.1 GntR family transcriptional regulator [Telmatospirillum siberiense]
MDLVTEQDRPAKAPAKEERRVTRGEEVTRQIADDIIHGRLSPGVKLDEVEVARRFGTSRTPVREALGQLCAMGLAERVAYRGVVVSRIAADRLADMFVVMAELEASAARLAALQMTPAERRGLELLHLASRDLVRRGDREAYAQHNSEFHSTLYAGSHNSYLEELLVATRKRLNPFRRAQFNLLGRLTSSHGEHDQVVQAILRGDADAAALAMRGHVMTVSAASAEYVGHQTSGQTQMKNE